MVGWATDAGAGGRKRTKEKPKVGSFYQPRQDRPKRVSHHFPGKQWQDDLCLCTWSSPVHKVLSHPGPPSHLTTPSTLAGQHH